MVKAKVRAKKYIVSFRDIVGQWVDRSVTVSRTFAPPECRTGYVGIEINTQCAIRAFQKALVMFGMLFWICTSYYLIHGLA